MRHHTQWLVGVYAQDDWRALTDLTVNAGLRYEIVTVPNEVDGKITNVRSLADPKATLGAPLFNNPSLHNVAPRMGFVYSPSRKSRLTGGPNATSVGMLKCFLSRPALPRVPSDRSSLRGRTCRS